MHALNSSVPPPLRSSLTLFLLVGLVACSEAGGGSSQGAGASGGESGALLGTGASTATGATEGMGGDTAGIGGGSASGGTRASGGSAPDVPFVIEDEQDTEAFFSSLKTKKVASHPGLRWLQFGPGMSGNNKSAFWHPTDPDALFVAPNMGNSYRSTDAGHTYETVYDEDAPGFQSALRGPEDTMDLDFSRQDPDFGFATDMRNAGIFVTDDRGHRFTKHQASLSVFGDSYLSAVTVDPKDDDVWYVGAGRMRNLAKLLFSEASPHGTHIDAGSQKKIWKTTDRGASWKLVNSGLHDNAEVESIYVDPTDSQTLFVSTNYGFYKSTDGGENWVKKPVDVDNDVIRSLAVHHDEKTDKLTMYALNSVMWKKSGNTVVDRLGGVFKSTDRGETWTQANGNLALDLRQFAGNNTISKSYYTTVAYYFGISESEAKAQYPDLPSSITQRFTQIEVDPTDADNIYLVNMYSNASKNNFLPGQMWRSKDAGNSWHVTFRNGKNWDSGGDVDYWVSRGNPVGSNAQFRYPSHWQTRDAYDRKACNFAKFNADGTVLHTQMAKVSFMSYDKGETWLDIDDVETSPHSESWVGAGSSNVPGHGFYQHALLPGQVFAMAGEGTLWVTNDQGDSVRPGAQAATFTGILGDEQSLSSYAIHPSNTDLRYALFFRQAARGALLKTSDGGETWTTQGQPIAEWSTNGPGDQSIHQLNLMLDESDPDTMYFHVPRSSRKMQYVGDSIAQWGVHRSRDEGKTWQRVNNGLPSSLDVADLEFEPGDPTSIYAAVQSSDGGLYVSRDRGESWSEVASAASLTQGFGVNDIHFATDGKVYITTGWINAEADGGGLWVSDDDMQTWNQIFDYPWVNRIETSPHDPDVVLMSTLANYQVEYRNAGVFLSHNGGRSWAKVNLGNGQSDRVNDIAIDQSVPGKYYASTFGAGWYVATE